MREDGEGATTRQGWKRLREGEVVRDCQERDERRWKVMSGGLVDR